MANIYALRIHEFDGTTRAKVQSFCAKAEGSYMCVRETDATRTHYQGWIRTDLKEQALRRRLKLAFPEAVGNKGYSLTNVKDYERYHAYILKGTKEVLPEIVCYSGIDMTPEDIEETHKRYWREHEKPVASNRSIMDEVLEWAKSQTWPERTARNRAVAERLIEATLIRKKPVNVFYLKGVLRTILGIIDHVYKDSLVDEILSNI